MYIFNSFHLLLSYNPSFLICLCFNMASFKDQKNLGPRSDQSPLGVQFKISDEHSPPPGLSTTATTLQWPHFLVDSPYIDSYL